MLAREASRALVCEDAFGLWLAIGLRTIFSLPYLEARGKGLDVAIVLIDVSLKRAQMFVGVAPCSGEVPVWLEQQQRHAVGLDRSDRCGYMLGAVIGIRNRRGDGCWRLQP
jgi:hypothetical protein